MSSEDVQGVARGGGLYTSSLLGPLGWGPHIEPSGGPSGPLSWGPEIDPDG